MTYIEQLPAEWQALWQEEGFNDAAVIQEESFQPLLEGKNVLGISPTGSGKTLAYLLPLLTKVVKGEGNQLLILQPSQELAMQVAAVARKWSKPFGFAVLPLTGGANIRRQIEKLKERPEVLVGTPGRVLELIKQKKVKSHLINAVVLDEVDQLLEETSRQSSQSIIKTLQQDTQLAAYSATGLSAAATLSDMFSAELVTIDVTGRDRSQGTVTHAFVIVPTRKRTEVLRRLAHIPDFRALVFFNQVSELGVVSERLTYLGVPHATLASDQNQMERKLAVSAFADARLPLLLTTDVAARGLDFADLSYIVQYDQAQTADVYTHRSGRTGRMGHDGMVLTLSNERAVRELKKVVQATGHTLQEVFVSHGAILDTKPEKKSDELPDFEAKKTAAAGKMKKEPETKRKKKKVKKKAQKNKGVRKKNRV